MKLILIFSTQFGKFVPDFMLPLLYRGYCMFEQDLGCDRLHTMVKKKTVGIWAVTTWYQSLGL